MIELKPTHEDQITKNNAQKTKYGQALTPVQRILPNAYSDQLLSPRRARNGAPLPSARIVSTTMTTTEGQTDVNVEIVM